MTKRILVVEDNEYKRKRIVELLTADFPDVEVSECYSFTSAWKAMTKKHYDLVLLDMSLPTFDKSESESGGTFRAFGGKELARKIVRRKIESKFIFVTQYKNFSDSVNSYSFTDLKNELLNDYLDDCFGFILYSNSQSEWKEYLSNSIREAIK